jgi:hypothetical protein
MLALVLPGHMISLGMSLYHTRGNHDCNSGNTQFNDGSIARDETVKTLQGNLKERGDHDDLRLVSRSRYG